MNTPSQIRIGKITFPVWQTGDGRYAIDYHDGTRRRVIKRTSIDKLREDAKRIALQIQNGETEALQLTPQDCRIYVAAQAAIAHTGQHLDQIARDYAAAWKLTDGRASLQELARYWKHRNPHLAAIPATSEIVTQLLNRVKDDRRSDRYQRDLSRDLRTFAAAFPDLSEVTEEDIREHLRGLTMFDRVTKQPVPVGSRRRDNVRNAIVTLFLFARSREYLPADRKTVVESIPRIAEGKVPGTFAPHEIALLLEHVSDRWRPWFLIAAFAGLRTSEVFRLDWRNINFEQRVIAVPRTVAKKVRISRQVPIADNLLAWLQPYAGQIGAIYHWTNWRTVESAHWEELSRLQTATGVRWMHNGLRHSFGSHRLAVTKSYDQVALEMGNSPAKVRENYNDPKSETIALQYFSIMPPESAGKVVQLPLQIRF